jgi:hypothetical protein
MYRLLDGQDVDLTRPAGHRTQFHPHLDVELYQFCSEILINQHRPSHGRNIGLKLYNVNIISAD